jgi:hypothetical protein
VAIALDGRGKNDVTMIDAMVEALKARFGMPE